MFVPFMLNRLFTLYTLTYVKKLEIPGGIKLNHLVFSIDDRNHPFPPPFWFIKTKIWGQSLNLSVQTLMWIKLQKQTKRMTIVCLIVTIHLSIPQLKWYKKRRGHHFLNEWCRMFIVYVFVSIMMHHTCSGRKDSILLLYLFKNQGQTFAC